ncbi:MAG: nucleotidyl transferase [Corynebacteriales bacterium]|nr:nucleotidyl transferase [Mycobacteriales bacterium]
MVYTSHAGQPRCAVVLAAGLGTRLAPLTTLRPKPLCPIGNSTPLDDALTRAGSLQVAVNASWLADQVREHVGDRAHISHEPTPLGTAGAIGKLNDWIDGRDVTIYNADAYIRGEIPDLDAEAITVDGRSADPDEPILLVVRDDERGDFGPWRFIGISHLPAKYAAKLQAVPSGLYAEVWRKAATRGRLQLVPFHGTFYDCGTPRDYLMANLHASGGASVVGHGADVQGQLTRSVVWPDSYVGPKEHLIETIRAGDLTVTTIEA